MGYSKFRKIQDVVERFNLDMRLQRLFQEIESVSPSDWLLETLSVSELLPLTNEKSKAVAYVLTAALEVLALSPDDWAKRKPTDESRPVTPEPEPKP